MFAEDAVLLKQRLKDLPVPLLMFYGAQNRGSATPLKLQTTLLGCYLFRPIIFVEADTAVFLRLVESHCCALNLKVIGLNQEGHGLGVRLFNRLRLLPKIWRWVVT